MGCVGCAPRFPRNMAVALRLTLAAVVALQVTAQCPGCKNCRPPCHPRVPVPSQSDGGDEVQKVLGWCPGYCIWDGSGCINCPPHENVPEWCPPYCTWDGSGCINCHPHENAELADMGVPECPSICFLDTKTHHCYCSPPKLNVVNGEIEAIPENVELTDM